MASIQQRGEKWQLRVVHPLLPKAFFSTFESEAEAHTYADQLEALLVRGVVPRELLEQKRVNKSPELAAVIRAYVKRAAPAPSDLQVLTLLEDEVRALRVGDLNFAWVEKWVADFKTLKRTPGTIRKRVGSLARVVDWHLRDVARAGEPMPPNPLRQLPRGYSTYKDAAVVDEARDFRLSADEMVSVRAALAGEKREGRERAWPADAAFVMFFDLILDTGLRLREAYRLRVDQLDTGRGVLKVEGSKGHRGKLKPRVVPLKPALRASLTTWCKGREGLMFPFWDGTPDDLDRCTGRLSAKFGTLFDYASVAHLTEHDMRHEAACRWVMLKNGAGQWVFNDTEICRIMGWSNTAMMLRYASLRGEDLSARLQ